jgi:hypothetical protein
MHEHRCFSDHLANAGIRIGVAIRAGTRSASRQGKHRQGKQQAP